MTEKPPTEETKNLSLIFHSTTLENFKTCAIKTENGIVYEKQREERHNEPDITQVLPKLSRLAITYANQRATKTNSTPIILEGHIDQNLVLWNRSQDGELPPYSGFPVEYVWIPKQGQKWNDSDLETDNGFVNNFLNIYQKVKAEELFG